MSDSNLRKIAVSTFPPKKAGLGKVPFPPGRMTFGNDPEEEAIIPSHVKITVSHFPKDSRIGSTCPITPVAPLRKGSQDFLNIRSKGPWDAPH